MIQLRLPFEHTVIGYLTDARGDHFAMVHIGNNPHHPFATYMVGPDGDCASGDYHVTYDEARSSLLDRAGWATRARVRV